MKTALSVKKVRLAREVITLSSIGNKQNGEIVTKIPTVTDGMVHEKQQYRGAAVHGNGNH